MKRPLRVLALCGLVLGSLTFVRAGELTGFRADLLGQIEYVQKQVLDLENSMPDAKMTWRPGEGVRSVSEVYAHIAQANYLFGKMIGWQVPKGMGTEDAAMEKSSTDKKVIHDELVKSFDYLKNGIKGMSDANLDKTVMFFGQKMTTRGVLISLLSHIHEHLGQSIAYARINGVVPPWTAAQQAAEKAKK